MNEFALYFSVVNQGQSERSCALAPGLKDTQYFHTSMCKGNGYKLLTKDNCYLAQFVALKQPFVCVWYIIKYLLTTWYAYALITFFYVATSKIILGLFKYHYSSTNYLGCWAAHYHIVYNEYQQLIWEQLVCKSLFFLIIELLVFFCHLMIFLYIGRVF